MRLQALKPVRAGVDGRLILGERQIAALAANVLDRTFAAPASRQPIHQGAVPVADGRSWRHLLDEPIRQRLRQCGD
jgi:hypothetical protein